MSGMKTIIVPCKLIFLKHLLNIIIQPREISSGKDGAVSERKLTGDIIKIYDVRRLEDAMRGTYGKLSKRSKCSCVRVCIKVRLHRPVDTVRNGGA